MLNRSHAAPSLAAPPLHVEPLAPGAEAEWDAYVRSHPDGNVYHLSAWRAVAVRAYRLPSPFLVAREGHRGPLRGVLPLYVVGNPFRRYVTNGLFGSYGVVLADSGEARARLLDEARRVALATHAGFVMLKSVGDEAQATGYVRHDPCVIATMPLAPSPQTLWRGFRDKIRNSIRKAEKSGLEARFGGEELLEPFYDVLAENMHRKGTPIYGLPVMRELLRALGDEACLATLWKDGAAVSGAMVARFRGTVYVPFASSRPAAFRMNPNNLLYWEIIRRACESGQRRLDFGRSPRDSTTLAFKLGWGAVTTAQPFLVHTTRGRPPRFDADSPTLKRLIHFWQSLPRPVADALGPGIHRQFLI